MRFGLFTTLYDCGGGAEAAADVLDNLREQVVLAEQLGYDAVSMGEHHFGPYGLGDLPNPILVGADLAVRTSRIRIGEMANIAPWRHPIRLAEDLAILDNLTRGRIDVGFGRGVWSYEGPQFHPHADPRRDAANRELFRETVEIVRKAWTEERFAHAGANYTFPAPDTRFAHPNYPPDPTWQDGDRVLKLRVTPKPFQRPHPPLWMTVSTDRSVSFAAELGLRPCYWQPPPRRVRQRMELYAEVRSRIEGRPVSAFRGPGGPAESLRGAFHGGRPPGGGGPDPVGVHLKRSVPRARRVHESGRGARAGCEARLGVSRAAQSPRRAGGARDRASETLLVEYAHPGIPQRLILRNLELFATQVMPAFRDRREPGAAAFPSAGGRPGTGR